MPCTRTGIPLRAIPAGDGHVMKRGEGVAIQARFL